MVKDKPNIKDVQERIANACIGTSTLRNQGAPKVIEKARSFCKELNLAELSNVTEGQFKDWLDRNTDSLAERFPKEAKGNWGAARKAINVFLEEAFYNRFLFKEYELQRVQAFLEIPIDKKVAKGIKEDCGKNLASFPDWSGIKNLTFEQNNRYQERANELAEREGTLRVLLDLKYWKR